MDHRSHEGIKALGLEWAPLNIPFERRLQTFAVFFHWVLMMFSSTFFMPFISIYVLLFTKYYWIMLLYLAWLFLDRNTPAQGSRPQKWFRNMLIWQYFRDYFPIELYKTADLTPEKSYIFGLHPHGVLGPQAAFLNFGTEANGFGAKFPGIKIRVMTLAVNFWIPILREYVMSFGLCPVSKESIGYLLDHPAKGYGVLIVVGGAQEALNAHPGKYELTLSNRKGFVKLAMKHGADLVPVFSFGENEVFTPAENPEGSILRKIQMTIKKLTGVSPVVFHGRGIFNYTMGLLPYRKPIKTVVGKPLTVPHIKNPNQEEVDAAHKSYIDALKELFDQNKEYYGHPKDMQLEIL